MSKDQPTIFVETEEMRGGFAQVPKRVLLDKELSAGARLTYACLLWLAWEEYNWGGNGYEGQRKLAEQTGMSKRALVNYMRELSDAGYIEVQHDGDARDPARIVIRRFADLPKC